jgi:hypothetical protein
MATTNIDKQSFGQAGATFLSGADEVVNREICAILFLEDSVLHATYTVWNELNETSASRKLIGDATTVTIPNGVTIVGQFTSVGLDSGAALCYHAA